MSEGKLAAMLLPLSHPGSKSPDAKVRLHLPYLLADLILDPAPTTNYLADKQGYFVIIGSMHHSLRVIVGGGRFRSHRSLTSL
ncbi:MAG: hypothetical protein JWQ24_839 [Tardiphaga sp.]|nr:hypothetical protein [Tardiphaga sp.]